MVNKRNKQPTEYQVEFWTCIGKPRKNRSRYYNTAEGMLRAGARWEAKGSDYYCRYWNGLNTWLSAARAAIDPSVRLSLLPKRGGRGPKTKIYSIFGQCEAVAAEIMIQRGEATRILKEHIPDLPECQVNVLGQTVRFAIMIPVQLDHAFNELCKDIRA